MKLLMSDRNLRVTAGVLSWVLSACFCAAGSVPLQSSKHIPAGAEFSYGYWANGWRKLSTDTSPDALCYETGNYAFLLDVDDLSRPRFGLLKDQRSYLDVLASDTGRLRSLAPADLRIALEHEGKTYRATSCRSGVTEGIKRLESTWLWESGRFHQHFEVLDLRFADDMGNPLGCFGSLHLYGWPQSLTMKVNLRPDEVYRDGIVRGLAGTGLCILEKPLDIAHGPELDPEQLTVELWVKFPEQLAPGRYGWLLSKNNNEWENGNFGFSVRGAKTLHGFLNIGGGKENVFSVSQRGSIFSEQGIWQHLALSYDGGTLRLYVNGTEHGNKEIGKKRQPGSGSLRLGQRADGLLDVFPGIYDELRIWNRALTAAEISDHYKQRGSVSSKKGLTFHRGFNSGGAGGVPKWTDATLSIAFKAGDLAWENSTRVEGEWKQDEEHSVVVHCNLPGAPEADSPVDIRVSTPEGQTFPVTFSPETNCRKAYVGRVNRVTTAESRTDGGMGNRYDEFMVEVENRGSEVLHVPFQMHIQWVPGITGLVPLLCEEDGTPTGIHVQLSKNWHYGAPYLHAYTLLPADPGVTRYRMRVAYGFYGTVPSASHGQLSLVGWGGNGRWDQLAIGSWGEVFCMDLDMSNTDVAITDTRGLYLRNGKDGKKWDWSDGGWGGDWLGLFAPGGEKLSFTGMKTAYLAHGPCLTNVRYQGGYGPRPGVQLEALVQIPRVDDHARTFNSLRYTFFSGMSAKNAWLFKMGGGHYMTPRIAYGNRDGLIAEHEVPQTLRAGEVLREPVTLEGEGPWWVAYPGAYVGDHRDWGTGSRALVIRSYSAWFGSRRVTNPTLAFPVNTRLKLTDRSDINLLIVPPPDVTDFEPGDRVEMDIEWIVVPREADDYYGPNEAFRNHLMQHPRSWKTVHREAVGNDLEVTVTGGKLHHRYPVIVEASASEVTVDIKGGVGYVPIRFGGLESADGYVLYEADEEKLIPLDQSEHGRDFWQTDCDPETGTLSMTFNVLLDGKPSSRWVLKKESGDR